jgi:hypothetical protein
MSLCRDVRNKALVDSDWTQARDVNLSNDAAWKTYRQALRDFPKTWETTYDNMTDDDKVQVKESSIQNSLPTKPL